MSLIVQKFGGSSVADATSIARVAKRVVDTKQAGNQVVVVVSAMGDTTDELLDLANAISPNPPAREMDILLTAGERISMALLAMAISELGVQAQAFTGQQAGVITDTAHGNARIAAVTPKRIQQSLDAGSIAIVAGFQGVTKTTNDVTTLGRGGSDTTAVALAAALNADVCEIYTDVDGMFTADPRIVPTARRIERISTEETLEMAAHGAKILHLRAVEYARRYGVTLHVRSSFSENTGTLVTDEEPEEGKMEDPLISGVAHDRSQAKVTVIDVPDVPGSAARVFEVVAAAGVNLDMIVQNVPTTKGSGVTDISFTLNSDHAERAANALRDHREEIGYWDVVFDNGVGKLSLVGAGMRSHPGVAAKLFGAIRDSGINIEMISTSEIRISVITRRRDLDKAVRAVHEAFELDAEQIEAVVYGGTGR
ncbi:MAG TPA: aspartate kinase [Beutenbergiaceae bacterium]|nr:aspartate kinase [Beutenbergiaceae bacterium]